ncbi:MAG: hypothetical protein IKY17_02870 [Oscillospiraceae bacterium]|nr:hypothetical protein [Oscillospiraceae bacterium]
MRRIIANACSFFGALIRNMFVIILAAGLMIVFGVSRVRDLNAQLADAREQISCLNEINLEQADVISSKDREIAQLNRELEEAEPDPALVIRQEIRFLGCINLGSVCFSQNVSENIFDSICEGDDISMAPWLLADCSSGLISARFFVAAKIA